MKAMSGAEIRIERGRVRRGSLTSAPITAQSSSPAKANAIDAQRLSLGLLTQVRDQARGVHRGGRGAGEERVGAKADEQDSREVGPQRAEVLEPAPGAHAYDVEGTASQSAASVAGSTYVQLSASPSARVRWHRSPPPRWT